MKTYPKYLIFSGEGETGSWKPYKGKETDRAMKNNLTRERSHGDRWAQIWEKTDMVDKQTGAPMYACYDPETGDFTDQRSIELDWIK